jgi:hypothetical protein
VAFVQPVRVAVICRVQIWSATSALDWEHLMEGAAPPQRFLDALKSTLGRSPPTHLSACARTRLVRLCHHGTRMTRTGINLLHGLLSVGFDLQWRDQFQAGITSPENHASDWRASHFAVLDCWKRASRVNRRDVDPRVVRLVRRGAGDDDRRFVGAPSRRLADLCVPAP